MYFRGDGVVENSDKTAACRRAYSRTAGRTSSPLLSASRWSACKTHLRRRGGEARLGGSWCDQGCLAERHHVSMHLKCVSVTTATSMPYR